MCRREAFPLSVILLCFAVGCTSTGYKHDSWNSYYYGGYQLSGGGNNSYIYSGGDNDSNYVPPRSGSIDPVMPAPPSANMRQVR